MLNLTPDTIRLLLLTVVAILLSSAVHEWAHALTAYKLGDDTAARQGRLTLNPIVHIDPIGTLVLPAVGALMGFLFGYAKPVPISPAKITRRLTMSVGVMLIALAGPLSNLILAFLCAGLLKLITVLTYPTIFAENELAHMMGALLFVGVWLNVVLCLFNFLPVYPLDGSRILEGVVPRRYHRILEAMERHSVLVMLFVLFIGIRLLSVPISRLRLLILDLFDLSYLQLSSFYGYF